ncbi:thiamine/thiamine pyrophosphate ABC transporter permease ThiP [Rhizobiales bacterium RZME27]|uniref:Thiamine transport system permease protein ThiP n=1 Tax=Endobacterium cereale TaxID=2663029 RepID=A0A6A8AB88_9HYPH|nr:thiamine/thiamine pyrophosphate ABC transporter permease ThiP [Endobacterium cereale]MEB2847557.1 thiamine/thiamine pyrophosphate ABC transporter permease ThiP [Endobacterium cereale]MQY47984.1 thiamine/thiamine pyrophosphate ABC transporter permease ThiP [Endobacterium cereale]
MLTSAERQRGYAGGGVVFAGIVLFIALAVFALLSFDSGETDRPLFDAYVWRILRFTLWQAGLSTLLSLALALPVALALARQPKFPGRIWIIRLMAVPMGLPVLIGALGLIGIWGRTGILNSALAAIGLSEPISIYGLSGILIAHVFFNLPLACRLLLAGLERLPPDYWRLSASLGLPALSVFRFVEWPAVKPLLAGVAGLVFMLCATSFTLVLVLGGGPAATTLEVAIYQSLRFDFDPARAISLALLQIAVTATILALMALLPTPSADSTATGRAARRFDGTGFGARAWDRIIVVLAVLFLCLPLASILLAGLKADFARLLTAPVFWKAAWTSLWIAFLAGLISLTTSIAIINARAAITDARKPGLTARGFSALLASLSSLVLLVPPVVIGTGWFLLLRPYGDVASFAPLLVVMINAMTALPFVIRVLSPAFATHRQYTARQTANLGIFGFSRLRLIDLPVLTAPLATAFSFAMALSLGDLGAVALFGSEDLVTLPWLVYSRLGSYRTADADGFALILALLCLGLTIAGTVGQRGRKDDGS